MGRTITTAELFGTPKKKIVTTEELFNKPKKIVPVVFILVIIFNIENKNQKSL